jgi:amino acid adenylation domain-containing protein/thioester reductase-like protein
MERKESGEYFPLSLSQQNIWNLECSLQGTSVNNLSATIQIEGRVDFVLLQESIQLVLEADDSLRTRIITGEDGSPVQYHAPFRKEEFPVYDLTHTSSEGIGSWETAMTREPIPLNGGPLYRFVLFRAGENAGGVLVKIHHIISDGWAQLMVCNKIAQTYLNLLGGKPAGLEKSPDYRLHIKEENDYLSSRAYEKDKAYWTRILEESGEPSVLKNISSAAVSPLGSRVSFDLPQVLNHAVYRFCTENRVAPFAVFYMALAIYFKRIGGADRFTIGVPIMNRTNYVFKRTTGMFVTTLPFFNRIDDSWSWNQFNRELTGAWFDLLKHQRFPFSHIEKLYQSQDHGEGRLFHIALSYQNSQAVESRDASVLISGRWHYSGYQAEQLCIHVTNMSDSKCYSIDYDYLTQFFAKEEIERLHHTICNILLEALANPDKPIYRLSVLTTEEREKVLYTFNRTGRYLEDRSVFDALETSADEYPRRVAAIFRGERLTYQALLMRAFDLSGAVLDAVQEEHALAAVMLPRGFALLETMAGILRAGCAWLLLSPDLPSGRVRKILEQSGASVLVTSRKILKDSGLGRLEIPVVFADEVEQNTGQVPQVQARPEDLAYVVYTSGSTGTPKGVEITQKNLLNLAQAMEKVYGKGAVLSVCSVGFDAFMLESIVPLLNGKTIVIADEEEQESPRKLAALIRGFAVGFCSVTPSRLEAFLKEPEFCSAVRHMEGILCGGEAFSAGLLKKLKNITGARIYNQYGPSETTVGVSLKELSHAKQITAGKPMDNCRLYVLDKWLNPLPVGVYGRLFVGGLCVGKGYRNEPEMTAESFVENPFEDREKMYDTGDSACWTEGGEIVLGGRLDSQVKLRGQRIEPSEVAACISGFPGVRAAAAKVCQLGGQPVLTAYYCSDTLLEETELLAFAATYLPHYMIPSCVMRLDEIPVTAGGKTDERKLPDPVSLSSAAGTADGCCTESGEKVLRIFRTVLGREDLDGGSDYFLSGGNSLNAMETIAALEEEFGCTVRIADLYACRTAGRLSRYLAKDGEQDTAQAAGSLRRIRKAAERRDYPLSPMQQGIYVQSYLDPTGIAYNMPGAFLLPEETDAERLEQAFRTLIRADEVFRTAFVSENGKICARVADEVPFALKRLEGKNFDEVSAQFVVPFDLGKAPLLRAGLWTDPAGRQVLLMDSHHIIGDGMSTPLVLRRLNEAYCGRSLEIPLSYTDYAVYLEEEPVKSREREREYWRNHLDGLPEPLVLPADFQRPHAFDFRGQEYRWTLTREETAACEGFCRERGLTSFMLFLAAFGILLGKISGREDFLLGTPVAGRLHPGTGGICGPFINALPLRLRPESGRKTETYLQDVRREVAGLLDHQEISLEEILSMLKLPRSAQNPLYQMMFSQSPVDTKAFVLDGKAMEFLPVATGTVKMDMTVETAREGDRCSFQIASASSLFKEETIRFYGRCFCQILREILSGRALTLADIQPLCPEDYEKYVEAPGYAATPFVNLPIHRFIEQKEKACPDAPAIVFHGKTMTREMLEKRACGLAAMLREAGVKPGQCVGLGFARTPDLIAAMIAILKTGCAYVPLLPSFPEERLAYMLETAGAAYVLCDGKTAEKLPHGLPCRVVEAADRTEERFENAAVKDEDLVNVMFTSGSTGKPKGVMLRHRSVSSLFVSIRELLSRAKGPILCTTNVVFDSFIGESLFPLAMGKTVILTDEEEMMLPWKLAEIIEQSGAEIFQVTPARLQMCLGNEAFCRAAASLKLVLLGGEVLTPQLLEKLHSVTDAVSVNMYGPTEATVYMTMIDVKPGDHITIGRPLYNGRIYVLDEQGRPVMPTGCGELYMAGECLARGYISRPDLTEKAFLPDPFFPGERMYKSGDLGRLRLDGSYDFLGRRDSQVKLNGQRVELDEITGAILESGYARQAATVAIRREDGAMELCAFFQPAGEEEECREKLMASIRKVLPVYMVPSRILALESMPLTASSKIDVRALTAMATEGISHAVSGTNAHRISAALRQEASAPSAGAGPEKAEETAVPETVPEKPAENRTMPEKKAPEPEDPSAGGEQESAAGPGPEDRRGTPSPEDPVRFVLDIWKQVLTRQDLSADESFFDQGGTSLEALNVLSLYFNRKLEMSLAQFYEHPTAREQAELLGLSEKPVNREKTGPEERLVYPEPEDRRREKEKRILLTGATGFFGAHLLKALLEKGGEHIVCLVRGGSERRLTDCLSWYFGSGFVMRNRKAFSVVGGDLTEERLGLPEEEYEKLAGQLSEIYHAAADVRHYAADGEGFLRTNVDGTRHLLELAEKAGAAFYHMSTCSVSGEQLKNGGGSAVFTEEDYDIGQIWEDNIYVKSKFLAEGLVRRAAEKGLHAQIFRLGRLVGRASDGVFQKNPDSNAFYLLMRAFRLAGAIPQTVAETPVDLTPVDYAAEAVLTLKDCPGMTWHIIHPDPPETGKVAEEMKTGIPVVSDREFTEILTRAAAGPAREQIAVLIDYWRRVRQEPPVIEVSGKITQEMLAKKGFCFEIPAPGVLLESFTMQDTWPPEEE